MTMDPETNLLAAGEVLTAWTESSSKPENNRLDIIVSRTNLLEAVKALKVAHWGYLSAITGLDRMVVPGATPKAKDTTALAATPDANLEASPLEVLYHFCHGAAILTLRVTIARTTPSVPSICDLVPSASLYERELGEMYGIEVLGTPDASRLLLPDDWPNGVYPLRKDFTGLKNNPEPGKDSN